MRDPVLEMACNPKVIWHEMALKELTIQEWRQSPNLRNSEQNKNGTAQQNVRAITDQENN